MDYGLLQIFAFLRPLLYVDSTLEIGGMELSELTSVALSGLLIFVFLFRAVLTKKIYISMIEIVIIGFIIWCISIYIAYSDIASIKDLTKIILPPITYIVARNILHDEKQFLRVIYLMILGFTLPVLASAAEIVVGKGLEYISYWTGVARYQGVYSGAHNMAHNMAFLIMLMILYVAISKTYHDSHKDEAIDEAIDEANKAKKIFFSVLGLFAIYCLYKSAVRTASIGLIIFLAVYLYHHNKKILVAAVITGTLAAIIYLPVLIPKYFADFEMVQEGKWDVKELGSGRIGIWLHNLSIFSELPIDKMIGGVGIGNKAGYTVIHHASASNVPADSHNDFLDVLMETGTVGFTFFIVLQYLIWKSIMRLGDKERYVFLAIFLAVLCMNFLSNSYVARFGLGQMYYLLMAYVGMPKQRVTNTEVDISVESDRSLPIEHQEAKV